MAEASEFRKLFLLIMVRCLTSNRSSSPTPRSKIVWQKWCNPYAHAVYFNPMSARASVSSI
eukprot:1849231-Pleurochrysis_carterae.AAC.5